MGPKHLRLHQKVYSIPTDSKHCCSYNNINWCSFTKARDIVTNSNVMGQFDHGHICLFGPCHRTTHIITFRQTSTFKRWVHHFKHNVQAHYRTSNFPNYCYDGSCVCRIEIHSLIRRCLWQYNIRSSSRVQVEGRHYWRDSQKRAIKTYQWRRWLQGYSSWNWSLFETLHFHF